MTASTRSRLLLCLVVGLIALPAEALLLPVARTPNPIAAAVEWTASLDSAELRDAAANIDAYPQVYRKAIMGALPPDDRSSAWRQFFQEYLDANPSLSADQIAVVREAMDVASPAAFGRGISAETKKRITDVFTRAREIARRERGEGAVRHARAQTVREGERAAAAAAARRQPALVARGRMRRVNPSSCNCNVEIDTCDLMPNPWLACSELYTCEFDMEWPMCGPLWSWACTGWCKIIR